MSLELVADDGRKEVLPLFASTNKIRTIRILLGSTMVELSTTHQANSPTSLDVHLEQQQDPVPPLPSSNDADAAAAATSSPQEITPTLQPQPQATETMEAAPTENQGKIHKASKTEDGKGEKEMRDLRNWLIVVATVFATMTYQAGLTPPGGYWQDDLEPSVPSLKGTSITNMTTTPLNTTRVYNTSSNTAAPSNETGHEAGHAILQDKTRWRYMLFYTTNSAAFVYSMGSIVLLLSDTLSNKLKPTGVKALMVLNAIIIAGAYSAGSNNALAISAMCVFLLSCGFGYKIGLLLRRHKPVAAGQQQPA